MKKQLNTLLALSLVAILAAACSSSKKNETDNDVIAPPPEASATDAKTDAVPKDTPEAPPLPAPAAPAENPPEASNVTPPAPVTPPAAPPAPAAESETAQASPSADGQYLEYKVRKGDTLMKIAYETYGDIYEWKSVYDMNRETIKDPKFVPPGTVLRLEKPATPVDKLHNGEKYMIKSGDTLTGISEDVYGMKSKWRRLWDNNKGLIKNPNRIYAGFYLYYVMTEQDREEREGRSAPAPAVAPRPLAETPAAAPQAAAPQAAAPQASAPAPASDSVAPPSPAEAAPIGNTSRTETSAPQKKMATASAADTDVINARAPAAAPPPPAVKPSPSPAPDPLIETTVVPVE